MAAADEGELAALADDAANGGGEAARFGAVDDHLGDGELAVERLALRFPIDGAGEALGLLVGGLGARIVADQLGERARFALGRFLFLEDALRRGGGDGVGRDRRRQVARRDGIQEIVEAERLGGQRAARMLDIGAGRSRVALLGDRRAGEAAGGDKSDGDRGQSRGAEGASH